MQLRIVHTTGFAYDAPATSYNQARLTPETNADQIVVHTRLEVSPTPWVFTYRDYFGSYVTAFEVLEPYDQLTVTATSTVHTSQPSPATQLASWEELASEEVQDSLIDYFVLGPKVAPPEELAQLAQQVRDSCPDPATAVQQIATTVAERITYQPGSTTAASAGAEAWEKRGGVSQDLAHLLIGALRQVAIPARYVSGYLHPHEDPLVGETVAGDSHAWVEWWAGPSTGWLGIDPVAGGRPEQRHVVVATGRDYDDVTPLQGLYSGGKTEDMFVQVEVTRLG